MKDLKNESLRDLFHEFLIFAFFGLGIALPVIIYKYSEIISQVNISYLINASPFPGS